MQSTWKNQVLDYAACVVLLVPMLAWYWSSQHFRAFESATQVASGIVASQGIAVSAPTARHRRVEEHYVDVTTNGVADRFWLSYAATEFSDRLDTGDHVELIVTGSNGFVCAITLNGDELLSKDEFLNDWDRHAGWLWNSLVPVIGFMSLCYLPIYVVSVYRRHRSDNADAEME